MKAETILWGTLGFAGMAAVVSLVLASASDEMDFASCTEKGRTLCAVSDDVLTCRNVSDMACEAKWRGALGHGNNLE